MQERLGRPLFVESLSSTIQMQPRDRVRSLADDDFLVRAELVRRKREGLGVGFLRLPLSEQARDSLERAPAKSRRARLLHIFDLGMPGKRRSRPPEGLFRTVRRALRRKVASLAQGLVGLLDSELDLAQLEVELGRLAGQRLQPRTRREEVALARVAVRVADELGANLVRLSSRGQLVADLALERDSVRGSLSLREDEPHIAEGGREIVPIPVLARTVKKLPHRLLTDRFRPQMLADLRVRGQLDRLLEAPGRERLARLSQLGPVFKHRFHGSSRR